MSYVDSKYTATGSSVSSWTVNKPSGVVVGDVVCLVVINGGYNAQTFTWPSGFTEKVAANNSASNGKRLACAVKVLTGSEGSTFTVTSNRADYGILAAVAFRDRGSIDDILVLGVSNTGANANYSTFLAGPIEDVPAGADMLIAGSHGNWSTGNTAGKYTSPAPFTEVVDINAGTYTSLSVAYAEDFEGGTAGTYNTTYAAQIANPLSIMLALPAAPPTEPATLSDPFPSGTIEGDTYAEVGATTDTASGELYIVISTSDDVAGATAEQVEAGLTENDDPASVHVNGLPVGSLTPFELIDVLEPETTYYYAIVQVTSAGYSNVVAGSFTTSAEIGGSVYFGGSSFAQMSATPVAPYTLAGWFRFSEVPSGTLFTVNDGSKRSRFTRSAGVLYAEGHNGTSLVSNAFAASPDPDVWIYAAMVVAANGAITCYWQDREESGWQSQSVAAGSYSLTGIGYVASAIYGETCYLRTWNDALDTTELLAEMRSKVAVRTEDLLHDVRLRDTSDYADNSGNGNDLTLSGPQLTDSPEWPFGAESILLAIGEAVHGHAASGPALTQASTLAVAGASHAQASVTVELTQAVSLAVGSAAHLQAADDLELMQAQILAIADSAHAQVSSAPDLSQAQALAVGNAVHHQGSEVVALTQGQVLAVLAAVHAHAAAQPALTQAGALSVGGSAHQHAAPAVTLSQSQALGVTGAAHEQVSDDAALTQARMLGGLDATHRHAAGELLLTQASILTIGESAHSLVSAQLALSQGVTLAVEDALHGQFAAGLELSESALLAIASSAHLHVAGAVDLTQASVLIVSDSVHAQLARAISLRMPGGPVVPPGRTIIVQAGSRTVIVQAASRTITVPAGARTITVH